MKLTRKKIKIIITVFLSLIFFITLLRIVNNEIANFDNCIYKFFIRNDFTTSLMKIITYAGEAITIILIAILVVIFIKDKNAKWLIPLNLILITILTQSIKFIIRRPRPEGINLIKIDGYSFPSGHTMTAVAFYGMFIYLIYKKCKNKKLKYIFITLLTALIISIGISRIYLGVHYASDVLGGFALATAYLIIYTSIIEKHYNTK